MDMLHTFRAAGLAAVATVAFALPAKALDIEEVTSPGGITFWLVEEPSIPIVSLRASFEGGAALDPEDRAGLGRITMGLLDEGAGDLDTTAFARERDALAAKYSFSISRDKASIGAEMLTETLDRSAELLAMALTAPRFDQSAIERVRAQMLSGLRSDETDPNAVASKLWFARAFGGHPYGTPTNGTEESVAAITRDEIVAQLPKLMSRDRAIVSVVGAIGPERAGKLVDTVLGGLPETGPTIPALPENAGPPPGLEVDKLDVPQSVAIFGQKGLPRDDPDYIPAYVMNYILGGGGFSSRLMTEVREKRGLAYGVYSYLSDLEGAPLYIGSVQTANARIKESLDVILEEWRRMEENGVTADELEKAKKYLTGAFPLRFDSNAKIAGFLVAAQEEDLGIDYINRRNGLIEAVTQDDIARVAKRLLKPDQLSLVVVGEPEGL